MNYLYSHAGAANHGCEALVRTISKMCDEASLISYRPDEDIKYGLDKVVAQVIGLREYKDKSLRHIIMYLVKAISKKPNVYFRYKYSHIFPLLKKGDLLISIGGDNYCDYGMNDELGFLNNKFNKLGLNTALVGCSIEPRLLTDKKAVADFRKYRLITARESITYEALVEAGLTNAKYIPDSAFILDKQETPLPDLFRDRKVVGINLSPLIQSKESIKGIAIRNYIKMIDYIINNTDYGIALIPHVVWESNDDLAVLKELYNMFKDTNRVILLDEDKTLNCMEIKYAISKCSYFIAARTHASIAAYSTEIPTLVVGYSVKAAGIAKDLFGEKENFVLPVQQLESESDLQNKVILLMERENEIKTLLQRKVPEFKKQVNRLKEEIEAIND